jgi:Fe2+ transport system protein FeoA
MTATSITTLSNLRPGDTGIVVEITGRGPFRRRLLDMGFVKGATVHVVKHAPFRDPVEYSIGGCHVSLRNREAAHVIVTAAPGLRPPTDMPRGRHCRKRRWRGGMRRFRGRART